MSRGEWRRELWVAIAGVPEGTRWTPAAQTPLPALSVELESGRRMAQGLWVAAGNVATFTKYYQEHQNLWDPYHDTGQAGAP